MFHTVDFVPDYIRYKYQSYAHFQLGILDGEILKDQYGNFRLREEFQPQPYYSYPIIYNAQPIEQQNMIEFDMFNIEGVRGYYKIDEDGNKIRLVNAEDIARGAGIVEIKHNRVVDTSVDKYEAVIWNRVNRYAQSRLPYLQQAGLNPILLQYIPEKIDKESYIPIELAIQIISCADSDQAKLFQAIVSITVAREIDKMIENKYNEELKSLQGQINMKDRQIKEQNKVTEHITNYYQQFNSTDHCFTATELAKNYGLSAQIFNKLLHRLHMIYFVNGTWQVYQKYIDLGCTSIRNENGQSQTYWTENGKLVISVLLMNYGIEEGKPNQEIVNRLLDDI